MNHTSNVMLLTTYHTNNFFHISCAYPSVIQPGEELKISLKITAIKTCELKKVTWNLDGITNKTVKIDIAYLGLNQDLLEGKSLDHELIFSTEVGKEGYGEINMTLDFSTVDGLEKAFSWDLWISIFKRVLANNKNALEDDLRKRLVNVVNARTRNGHIFMADHVRFFSEFLNVEVTAEIAAILTDELLLEEEGLPVNEEIFYAIVTGQTQFYGMEKLELIYEEYCNESDDNFDTDDAREVPLNPI